MLPTLPYLYINTKKLSIVVEFIYIVMIQLYSDRDEEDILSVTPNINELFQHNLINVSYLTACYLYRVMMTLHF